MRQNHQAKVWMENEEVITFAGWIFTDGLPLRNPHVGLDQIETYLHANKASDTVITGFHKAKEQYIKIEKRE